MIVGARLQGRPLITSRPGRSLLHLSVALLVVSAVAVSLSPEHSSERSAFRVPGSASSAVSNEAVGSDTELNTAKVLSSVSVVEALVDAPAAPDAGRAAQNVERLPAGDRISPSNYTVQPGDSLAGIAQQFGIDVPTLLGSNDLEDPDLLPTGLQLKVLPIRGLLYRVAEGDTLNRIAERYELAVREIMQANAIGDSELIAIGDDLVLPGAKPLIVRGPAAVETARAPVDAPAETSVARSDPPRVGLASAVIPAPSSGAVLPPAPAVRPGFVWPASGPITTYFGEIGWTSPRGHAGLDIAAPWGAPVRAAAGGQVIVATRAGGPYGIQVIVDHGGGLRTVYGHLSQLDVAAGESVERGELIGLVGSTGFSTGPHLHFEVRQNGELRDPLRLLP